MSMKLRLLILVGLMVLTGQAIGQKAFKKANKQFEMKAYDLAISNYTKVLEENPSHGDAQLKMAESFRLSNQYLDALRWYDKIVDEKGDLPAENMLSYAHTLKSVGLYDKAQLWYWKYKMHDPVTGEHFALSCDFAKNILMEEDKFDISLCIYNTPASDFGVTFFEDKMVLSSFRSDMQSEQDLKKFSNNAIVGNRLFIEGATPDQIKPLRSPLKNKNGIGPLHYSRDGKLVAYTTNAFVDGGKQLDGTEKNMSIYFGIADETGDFENEIPFPYNDAEYSCAFPMLSYNGTSLYFASNMPGGQGGFDIYVSHLEKGNWTRPENLGSEVNTPGNEITPFFDEDELFYSSDFTQGLGGFDVFSTRVVNGKWNFGENMGKGINSPSDDYYFSTNLRTGEMFFSSNRLGGRGNDDIYIANEIQVIDYVYSTDVEDDNVFVPRAVSLEDLKPIKINNNNNAEVVIETSDIDKRVIDNTAAPKVVEVDSEATTVTVIRKSTEAKTSKSVVAAPKALFNLFGARKISVGEVVDVNSRVYFIQLAAFKSSRGNVDAFQPLTTFGNIYKAYKSNSTKIKLGYFLDRSEAKSVLQQVKSRGYKDAFITYDELSSSDMEMVSMGTGNTSSSSSSVSSGGNNSRYKVRLAAYTDPLWFDTSKVKGLGSLEQWTKGEWTIFILSGFKNIEEAQAAKVKAMNKGFQEAELVIDNNGILERLQQN